jgi:hypothetical protein
MNSDDLRNALGNEAAQQPPVSTDLRAGVDRRVRRQRLRAVALVAPAIAFVLVAAVLLAPRGSNDTTLATADGNNGTSVATTTTVPAIEDPGTPTTVATGVPSPTDPTSVDCGTVNVGMTMTDAIETDRFDCFFKGFNGDGTTYLTVVMAGPGGGAITEKLTSAPGHTLTVAGSGSMTAQLPALNFGGGGSDNPFPGAATGGDCGTIHVPVPATWTVSSADPSSPPPSGFPGMKAMSCLLGAITGGGEGQVVLEVGDESSGIMTVTISIGADHVLTMSVDGQITMHLPADLTVPEDLLNNIPPGALGMGQMVPGMGPRSHKK